jgi:hypothetical protein
VAVLIEEYYSVSGSAVCCRSELMPDDNLNIPGIMGTVYLIRK